jgi:hypothetical protein
MLTTASAASTSMQSLPPIAWVAIGVLAVFTLVMYAISLTDLYRRPADQVIGGRKWVWLLVILFINSGLGAIIYLLAGRKPPSAVEPLSTTRVTDRAGAAVDALYGAPVEGKPR